MYFSKVLPELGERLYKLGERLNYMGLEEVSCKDTQALQEPVIFAFAIVGLSFLFYWCIKNGPRS